MTDWLTETLLFVKMANKEKKTLHQIGYEYVRACLHRYVCMRACVRTCVCACMPACM